METSEWHLQAAEPADHHDLLLDIIAEELSVTPADIVDFELNVCDTQPGVIGGNVLCLCLLFSDVLGTTLSRQPC